MDGYSLPFVERQPGRCPHTHTKWKPYKREERKCCLRCGMMLPRMLGIRHTEARRRHIARQRQRDASRRFCATLQDASIKLEAALIEDGRAINASIHNHSPKPTDAPSAV